MKKIAIALIAAGLVLGMSSIAAADNGEDRSQFFNFEEHLVEGTFVAPDGWSVRQTERPQFDPLHTMDTSFLDKISESSAAVD